MRACMRMWAGGRVGRQVIAVKLATVTISVVLMRRMLVLTSDECNT